MAPGSCLAGSGAAPSTAPELIARAATTSDLLTAVAEPRRREILNYLALQERAVGDIVVGLKIEQPSVSKHLRAPQNVGLVRVRRDGRHMFYRTNAEAIRPLHEWTKAFEELWQHQYWRERARRGKAEMLLPGRIWDRSTKRRGWYALACRWPHLEMSAIG
jgi:DNA-binding transcriptional ArsR family regulator